MLLRSHMQETCSHMSRDMNKAVRKDLEMIKDSSSRKTQAHILMRNQEPSTILQAMSERREQRRFSREGLIVKRKYPDV